MDVHELLYQMFMIPDPTLLRERTSTWMRRDYWKGLCNIWAVERWQETSTPMKVNRAANLEANKHTSGSVSFATQQSRLESYSQHMTEKYTGEEEQPQLDLEVWVATSGALKKGNVYGFGHSMNTSRAPRVQAHRRLVHSPHMVHKVLLPVRCWASFEMRSPVWSLFWSI
ncbi:hypothetical protein Taro_003293, partial [Colocasia esculenta]|nr:hypothetical protein [Colocasia esculenta]